MQSTCLPFEATHLFSPLFLDYITQKTALTPFYNHAPEITAFQEVIHQKTFGKSQRETLVSVLKAQYATVPNPPTAQIDALLRPNTFTVTTGHQLCLYTGPMYFVYKILTTVRLAEALKKQYPAYEFVPMYWLASEDHDFAEVNHFHLFGQKTTWESTQRGAVGKFKTNELADVLAQMQERMPAWEAIYAEATDLAEATRKLVHHLLGEYGIVCLDADDATLKQSLRPVMEADIFQQKSYKPVAETNEKLQTLGYKTQVNPREINFFYLREGFRERIVAGKSPDLAYQTAQGEYSFTAESMRQEIAQYPERFSPNVLLRPLYQELILPNLAYVGGPGELAYWLQFKALFEIYEVQMPLLLPRNFGLIISKTIQKKMAKLGLSLPDIFEAENTLKEKIITQTMGDKITLGQARQEVENTFKDLALKAEQWDKSLTGSIEAEKQKTLKSLETIEKKLQKAQETKAETELKQLTAIKEKLFPAGEPQERHDNVINFLLNNSTLIDTIYQSLEPFNYQLYVWQEEIV